MGRFVKEGRCQQCGKVFRGRVNKLFCSDRCRYLNWSSKETLVAACFYCGLPADGIDHVPPRCARDRIFEIGLSHRFPSVEVQCCCECNSALGSRAIWTTAQRKSFIKKYLRIRYARYLKMPLWSKSELMEMGENLRSDIVVSLLIKDIVNERLHW